MTPARITELLKALRWSGRGLAVALDEHENTVKRWLAGESRIPGNVAAWLELRARTAFTHPFPKDWMTREARKVEKARRENHP